MDHPLDAWRGDANLDGEFNSADLILVSAAGEYEAAFGLADRSIQETVWFIPWSALHAGMVYAKMGDPERAREWLGKVDKKDDRRAWGKAVKEINRLPPGRR